MYRYFVKMTLGRGEMMSQLFDSYDEAYCRMEDTLDADNGVSLVSGRVIRLPEKIRCIINDSTPHTIA